MTSNTVQIFSDHNR